MDDIVHLMHLQNGEGAGFFIGGDGDGSTKENGIAAFHHVTEGDKRPKHVLNSNKKVQGDMGQSFTLIGPNTAHGSDQSEHKFIQGGPKGWQMGGKIRESPTAERPQIGNDDLEIWDSEELTVPIKVGHFSLEFASVLAESILPRDQMLIDLASLVKDATMVGTSKMENGQLVLYLVVVEGAGGSVANRRSRSQEMPGIPKLLQFQSVVPS